MTALIVISNIHEFEKKTKGSTHGVKSTAGESEHDTHWKIGFYPPSLAYPVKHLKAKGVDIHFCSPKGGECKADPWGEELWDHPVVRKWLTDPEVADALKNTKCAKDLNGADYDLIHFVGGHGAFFDVAHDGEIARIVRECYEAENWLSATNDGLAGLLNVKLSNNELLVKGKKLAGTLKDEQDKFDCGPDLPFSIEDELNAQGAFHKKGIPVKDCVMKDQRILTGQNPNSAEPLARAIGVVMKTVLKAKEEAKAAALAAQTQHA